MDTRWETLKILRWRPRGGKERPLSAASGLARVGDAFWAVGDDLNHAIRIPDGKGTATGHRLFDGEPPTDDAERKKWKRDLESIFELDKGRLVAFPSGSKRRRARGALIFLDARGRFKSAREIDFRPLIDLLEKEVPDLNIEGGYVRRRRLVLMQRGNGKAGVNALVKVDLKAFREGLRGRWRRSRLRIKVKRKDVGRWGRVSLGFTDGFFHDGVAYFAAAAELGKDTYKDGKVLGSVIGMLPKGKPPVILSRLAGEKIEGLALRSVKDGRLEICAVTDNDDPRRPSRLLRTWI
jgi:hypothetical protein